MQSVGIPLEIRAKLAQLVSTIDLHWQEVLTEIWAQCDMHQMEMIQQHILLPKGIVWNPPNQNFEHEPLSNFAMLMQVLNDDVMRESAQYLAQQLESLRSLTDSLQIAHLLEQNLAYIYEIDVEEDFELQHEKGLLHRTFILNAAQTIHALNLDVPQDVRQLTAAQVKSFIIDIFLKQHFLGHAFHAAVEHDSAILQHPIFKYYLKREQKSAHFELLHSAELIFVLAADFVEHSAHAVTHFLTPVTLESSDQLAFNGLVIDLTIALENDYIEHLKAQVLQLSRIQSFISLEVQSLMALFQQVADTQLIPLLNTLASADQLQQVLVQFEQILKTEILEPLQRTVKFQLTDSVQYDFVYCKIVQLCQKLIVQFNVLQLQSSLMENVELGKFKQRLQAWLLLLQKRRMEIFTPHNEDEWEEFNLRSQAPRLEIDMMLREVFSQDHQFNAENTLGDYENDAVELLKAQQQLKLKTFMQLLTIAREHAQHLVLLDFELLDEKVKIEPELRSVALSQGDNGLSELPQIIQFSARYVDFEIEQFTQNFAAIN